VPALRLDAPRVYASTRDSIARMAARAAAASSLGACNSITFGVLPRRSQCAERGLRTTRRGRVPRVSGPPIISRGERFLRVFISSVIAGLTTARAEVAEVVRELSMEPWVFEQTPAHSGGLETSYLEQVAESGFVIWLEDGRTTEPVELEIRRAVESGRPRLLVFRLPAESRNERTQTLIAEDHELVKYVEVDEQGLAGAVRATLDDELVRAVRRPELPDGFALPARTELRGRADLADSLTQDIASGATVVISGMGGVGKTALAVELAHRQSDAAQVVRADARPPGPACAGERPSRSAP
jgi:hypothetical protein